MPNLAEAPRISPSFLPLPVAGGAICLCLAHLACLVMCLSGGGEIDFLPLRDRVSEDREGQFIDPVSRLLAVRLPSLRPA